MTNLRYTKNILAKSSRQAIYSLTLRKIETVVIYYHGKFLSVIINTGSESGIISRQEDIINVAVGFLYGMNLSFSDLF